MPLRILVADDEAPIVRALTRLLERAGHTVRSAGTAEEALGLLEDGTFDAALVDANMPGDGRTVLQSLHARPDFDGRMFLMTGDLPGDAGELPPGVRHLQKPFHFPSLLEKIEGG